MFVIPETTKKPEISQKEYLKRYLSKDKGDKKKKKNKVKISSSSHIKRSVIIDDDDLGLPNVASVEDEEFNFDYLGDEAPQIAGVIDERPPEIKAKENYGDKNRWKPVGEPEKSKLIQNSLDKLLNLESSVTTNGKSSSADINKKNHYDNNLGKNNSKSSTRKSPSIKERYSRSSNDSDASPPRTKNKRDEKERASLKKRISRGSDSDLSPPRIKSKHGEKGNMSAYKRYQKDDDSDLSPPRTKRKGVEKERFSKRYPKDDDSDLSPPRAKTKGVERERFSNSHPKERNHSYSPHRSRDKMKKISDKELKVLRGSDSDLSPPRKSKDKGKIKRHSKDDKYYLSPPRRKTSSVEKEHFFKRRGPDFGSDFSPPRKSKHEGRSRRDWNDSDISPPRKDKYDKRMKRRKEGDSDLSPPWKNKYEQGLKRKGSDSDLSPPRKSKHERIDKRHGAQSHSSGSKQEVKENMKSMDKTLDGKKAGLQDAKNLKEELRKLKEAENAMFEKMKANASGKTATAIMRDKKTGKIRDLHKEKEEKLKKSVKIAERENKYAKWGKGLKQIEEVEERIADYLHEVNKPLARYAGDDDLERLLKSREREGDPMLDYIKNKQKESIDIEYKGKPTYQGYYLPNRFNIRPGHRWDGVDRSSGYEKQWFERQNARKALQEEAYKWSTSDM